MIHYRIALPEDLEPLRQFSQRLFIDTYQALNTPDNMALYVQQAFSEVPFAADFNKSQVRYWLAVEQKHILAYTKLMLDSPLPPAPEPKAVEIARFYVDTPQQGTGLARLFMQHCLDWMHSEGYELAWLGVWPQNPRAVRFYQKLSFEKVGEATFLLGTDPQTDDLMRKWV
ncbi:GNAT family N-acetyltransferase [Telluribacter sp.]|jgi:GNAT superfamily N-acetyltransferase|uniref:GNAT family N-acetyltransferase n=1 Tax=Telluribacter sp. TaxID=1978767 RepID=UPI002E0FE29C|nr:GNAT family N-acetyltransferase [Telluribacter sp.]